nr:hypothetical protein [Armatimonas sp.]
MPFFLYQPPRQPPRAQPAQQSPRGSLLAPRETPAGPPPGESGQPRSKDIFPTSKGPLELTNEGAILTDTVRLEYDGYVVTSDRATYDEKRDYITFESNVKMETGQETFFAERIGFNRKTREFEATEAHTVLAPSRVGSRLLQPLLLWGKSMRREGDILKATDGFLTTCDLLNPHAKIGFGYAELVPKKRITLRDVTLYRYNTVIARLKHLTIPIMEDVHYSYLPNVGKTQEEGYFIKAVIGYSLSKTLPGLLRVDWMEKKGIGLGTDQAYRFGDVAAGRVNLYTLNDKSRNARNLNGQVQHEQRFGEIDARLSSDFQSNSYFAATQNSRTQNTNLTLNRMIGKASTGVTLGQNSSDSGGSVYRTSTYGLTQQLPLPKNGTLSFRFNGTDNLNASGTTRTGRIQENADLRASTTVGPFRAELVANRNLRNSTSGTSSGGSFFGGSEKLPELTLTTNQLKGPLSNYFSGLTLGYGDFLESISSSGTTGQLHTKRFLFQTDLNRKSVPLGKGGLRLDAGGGFRQTIYDGGYAAQYVVSQATNLSQPLGSAGALSLAYNYSRPYGGTPPGFRNDFASTLNGLSLNAQKTGGHASVRLSTGYDILQARQEPILGLRRSPWNQLSLNSEFRPSDSHLSRLSTTYDINTGKLTVLDHYGHFQRGNKFILDTSARYDPTVKKLREVRSILGTQFLDNDTRLTGNSNYNNITHRFDSNSLALTRAFHDYEITLSYVDQPFGFRTEKGINLSFRLKAFSSPQTSTGGRYGTPLDTGLGGFF